MASVLFDTYERNMRRQFWMNLLDAQSEKYRRDNFRASLINNPITGLPFGSATSAPVEKARRCE